MDKNILIQERGEIARRIANEGLNIYVNGDSELVQRYWELVRKINRRN